MQAPGLRCGGAVLLPVGQSYTDWHTYAVRWTPDLIEWQVDGQPTRTFTKDEAGGIVGFRPPVLPPAQSVGRRRMAGTSNDDTIFPSRLVFDYVRVYAFVTA